MRWSFGRSAHYCSVCFQAANERGCLTAMLVTMARKDHAGKEDLTYVIPFFTLYRMPPNISTSHLPCIFLVSGLIIWVCSKPRPPCNVRETSSKTPNTLMLNPGNFPAPTCSTYAADWSHIFRRMFMFQEHPSPAIALNYVTIYIYANSA